MSQNNSYVPTQDLSKSTGDFDYPGAGFGFSYPLSIEKGAATNVIEDSKTYEIVISGEGTSLIKASLMSRDVSDFFGEPKNPKGIFYRKFVDRDNITHLRFYGDNSRMVDITLAVPDPQTYTDVIVASFQFNSDKPVSE